MLISIQSLGCPKNSVDSEIICGYLLKNNFSITNDIENADIALINTCSFIKPAVEESIDAILNAIRLKNEGKIKHIIVAGCLSQRYSSKDLIESLPEVDAFIGVDEIDMIDNIINDLQQKSLPICKISPNPGKLYDDTHPRFLLTPNHYAYLKIAEGCNNKCTYCLIPKIRGRYRSRTIESLLIETEKIIKNNSLRELILVAEDTTYYGKDLFGKPALADLLENLTKIIRNKEIKIRLLYTHPEHYDDKLIDTISSNPNICNYLDIPLQHISDNILKKMNRKIDKAYIINLIKNLRTRISNLTIRSTFIVGFPGETETDFQELYDFIAEYKLERVGVFPFYNEDECPASKYPDQISEKIKKTRLDKLMSLQQKISTQNQSNQIGKVKQVLIDGWSENNKNVLTGRSCSEAPDIDGYILVINGSEADIGKWINVRISKAYPYNLIGEKICI